jgi:hypothetical protein
MLHWRPLQRWPLLLLLLLLWDWGWLHCCPLRWTTHACAQCLLPLPHLLRWWLLLQWLLKRLLLLLQGRRRQGPQAPLKPSLLLRRCLRLLACS